MNLNRLELLLASATYNGIDFVEVHCTDQTELLVHFLNTVAVKGTLTLPPQITITGGESVPTVPVTPLTTAAWGFDAEGRPLLTLATPYPGDFSTYRLSIASSALDPFYASVAFSFKAECPSTLDCETPTPGCPDPGGVLPAIDYLAKDFNSFRKALSDYSAQQYPDWVERDEPDVGMVMLEALAAVADELSYFQDRVAAESSFATCTERRSLVRHARLVDYEPAPATSAATVVQLDVATGPLPPGALLLAPRPDGPTLGFEVGTGLADPVTGEVSTATFAVDPRWNAADHGGSGGWRILPYWWDDSLQCLGAGATDMWVVGHGYGFTTGDPQLDVPGLALLIDTAAASSLDPPLREVVHLTLAAEEVDPLTGVAVTHLAWPPAEALTMDHDLTRTHLAGNLVPATEGRRFSERFVVPVTATLAGTTGTTLATGPVTATVGPPLAVARPGPNAACGDTAPVFLHTLEQGRLAYLAPPGSPPGQGAGPIPGVVTALPELVVTQLPAVHGDDPVTWQWRRSILQSLPFEEAYTVDPVGYIDVRPLSEQWQGPQRWEYDGDQADSVRFGDGTFGGRPVPGAAFDVVYRTTAGALGNVAAGAITGVDPSLAGIVLSATNPFPATGGADEEPAQLVANRAPYAFRAVQYRAVLAKDYEAAALTQPDVLAAGTSFRWTGSWLTVFTAAEPDGGGQLDLVDSIDLVELLDRRRMTGYESYVLAPNYVGLDLVVTVCAEAWAFRSEVELGLLAALGTGVDTQGRPAFFAPDNWTFGQPLERSALEAAAQAVNGVDGVVSVVYRRRFVTPGFVAMHDTVTIAPDEIVEVRSDPSRPDRGSLSVVVQGGK